MASHRSKARDERIENEDGGGGKKDSKGISPSWYPPAADANPHREKQHFEDQFEENFFVPSRIASIDNELIETVNDFHFAMMNDVDRNEFYLASLKHVIRKDSVVVEIGTGSGLLAMIAAKLGAKHVTAIEANRSLARIAKTNIKKNGFEDRIKVINKMSTDVSEKELPFGKADVLVSEILGTLLLSESALEYNEDARKRLLKEDGFVIPERGTQCVTLVQSDKLDLITSARNWGGLDFLSFNRLRDTTSLIFTKQLGCRLVELDCKNMSQRIPIIRCDFGKGTCDAIPPYERRIPFRAREKGTIHGAVYSWEVSSAVGVMGVRRKMTTHVEDTANQLARDMQWGQGIQLVDDYVATEERELANARKCTEPPIMLHVEKDEPLVLVVRYAEDGVAIQCLVERVGDDGKAITLPDSLDDDGSDGDDEEGDNDDDDDY